MSIRPMRLLSLFACCLLLAPPTWAKTEAVLQVNIEGRANAKRHRLILTDTARDGRDVMLVLSCRVDDPSTLGVALNFGTNKNWNIDGEDVVFDTGNGSPSRQPMSANEDFLVLGGKTARAQLGPMLQARVATFTTHGLEARFELAGVSAHVRRYLQLCPMNTP